MLRCGGALPKDWKRLEVPRVKRSGKPAGKVIIYRNLKVETAAGRVQKPTWGHRKGLDTWPQHLIDIHTLNFCIQAVFRDGSSHICHRNTLIKVREDAGDHSIAGTQTSCVSGVLSDF